MSENQIVSAISLVTSSLLLLCHVILKNVSVSTGSLNKINLGSWKKQELFKLLLSPHVPSSHGTCDACDVLNSYMCWSISVPPLSCFSATWHLGSHDLCMFKFIHLESCPKSLSKLKCHKRIVWICKLFALFVLLNLHWVPKRSYSGAFLATQAWSRST